MRLEGESGEVVEDATEADIRRMVEHEEFAILGDGDAYIQCSRDGESHGAYVLEYQEGSLDRHYRAVDEPITLQRVVFAFIGYLGRDPSWTRSFKWEKVDLS